MKTCRPVPFTGVPAGHARKAPMQRLVAAAVAAAVLLGTTGCASPYRFSPKLDTRLAAPGADAAARQALAGDLHLSLAALMDQRRQLWEAAGETELMKNATAMGLIGLGAVGLYKGIQGEQSRTWLTKAGLLASATYAGATWLQPDARQTIFLAGAVSLTCLALATAPYEMTLDEYKRIRDHVDGGRAALEQLATELRLVGRYRRDTRTWWLVRGGWNKLRWASRVLDSADAALGNIEQAGPRLRDMTAMLASNVATQAKRVSKNLEDVPSALAQLKPNTNQLIGTEIFPPLKKEEVDSDPPAGSEVPAKDDKASKAADTPCGPVTAASAAAGASAPAAATTPATQDTAVPRTPGTRRTPPTVAPPAATAATASAASAPLPTAEELAAEARQGAALDIRLKKIAEDLDQHLGPVTSFVQRVAGARKSQDLPPACGAAATTVTLVPDKRDIVLQPGESFQFLLQGESGRAAADFTGNILSRDVLDLSMPMMQATTAVRMTAGQGVKQPVNTVVRISDSKGQQHFDINVKVCPVTAKSS